MGCAASASEPDVAAASSRTTTQPPPSPLQVQVAAAPPPNATPGNDDDDMRDSTPIKNLSDLLRTMRPELVDGAFVFCSVGAHDALPDCMVFSTVLEKEGMSCVISKRDADRLGIIYEPSCVCGWITLMVHSALDAVGLTAAVANVLASSGLSANVIAGHHHDHILVPLADCGRAIALLEDLSQSS